MRRWFHHLLVFAVCVTVPVVSLAQDTDDDFVFDEDDPIFEEEEDSSEEEPSEQDSEESSEEESDEPSDEFSEEDDDLFEEDLLDEDDEALLDFEDLDPEDDEDLLGDESSEDAVLAPGTDNARLYRAEQDQLAGSELDEEVMAWEMYLNEYPNSIFRERIEERIDELEDQVYQGSIGSMRMEANAKDAELHFVSPLHMTNINPRTRLQVGLEFGFGTPLYARPTLDMEYAILRNVSIHGGFWGRYGGMGAEFGARYAFVKSAKLNFIATLIADMRLNINPVYFEARPQLALGKIIGPVQMMLTVGTAVETRRNASVSLIGGLHVSARLAPPVSVFFETDIYVRNLGRSAGAFTFDVVSFGLRLHPNMKKRGHDAVEINTAGHIPVGRRYLQYYFGAVQVQGSYYFPERR
jgi:hypothetical protein